MTKQYVDIVLEENGVIVDRTSVEVITADKTGREVFNNDTVVLDFGSGNKMYMLGIVGLKTIDEGSTIELKDALEASQLIIRDFERDYSDIEDELESKMFELREKVRENKELQTKIAELLDNKVDLEEEVVSLQEQLDFLLEDYDDEEE